MCRLQTDTDVITSQFMTKTMLLICLYLISQSIFSNDFGLKLLLGDYTIQWYMTYDDMLVVIIH